MTTEQYSDKRHELKNLLEQVLEKLRYVESHYEYLDFRKLETNKRDIELIAKRVYENIFKIQLVAYFQCGKSTSFNAMTGGLCCSPMGNAAIKCSAAPVSVQNVVDEKDVGAVVVMRSSADLEAILKVANIEFEFGRDDIEEAQSAWQSRFDAWKANPRIYNDDQRDLLFVAGVILFFYNNPAVSDLLLRQRVDVALHGTETYARFPDNYLSRYSSCGPSAFAASEVLFAFVKKIELKVRSSALERIGAVLVDSPGLFANAFDTRVTLEEMSDASAVWYLLNAKMPSDSELEGIKKCLDVCKGRIFFAANVKENLVPMPDFVRKIIPEMTEAIRGACGEVVDVHPFNALAALLYVQGEGFLRNGGRFEDESIGKLFSQIGCPGSDPAQQWRMVAKMCVWKMYPYGLEDFDALPDKLCEQGVQILRRESGWDGIVGAMENYVISTKAKSILIVDSSQKVLALVNELMDILQTREQDALDAEDRVKQKYDAAKRKLDDFDVFAAEQIGQMTGANGDVIDSTLARSLYQCAFTESASIMAEEAAPSILEESDLFSIGVSKCVQLTKNACSWIRSLFSDSYEYQPSESGYALECKGIIRSAVDSIATQRIHGWMNSIRDNRNCQFRSLVTERARQIHEAIKSGWSSRCASDDLLSKFTPELPQIPNLEIDFSPRLGRAGESLGAKIALTEMIKDIVASFVGAILGGVFFIPGEPLSMVVAALVVLLRRIFSDRNKQLMEIRDTISKELTQAFALSQETVTSRLACKLSPLRQRIVDVLYEPIRSIKSAFEAEKESAFLDLQKGEDERKKIAYDCARIREYLAGGDEGIDIVESVKDYIAKTEPLC